MKKIWLAWPKHLHTSSEHGMALVVVFIMITLVTILFSVFNARTVNKAQSARDSKNDQAAERMVESAVERLKSYFDRGFVFYLCSGLPGPETCSFSFDASAPASVVSTLSSGQFVLDQVNSIEQISHASWHNSFDKDANPVAPSAYKTQVTISIDNVDKVNNVMDITASVSTGNYKATRRARMFTRFRRRCGPNINIANSYIEWGPSPCGGPNFSWGRTNTIDAAMSYIEYECTAGNAVNPSSWDYRIKVSNGDATGPMCGWSYGHCAMAQRVNGSFGGNLNIGFFGACGAIGSMIAMADGAPFGLSPVSATINFTADVAPHHMDAAGVARIEANAVCNCN